MTNIVHIRSVKNYSYVNYNGFLLIELLVTLAFLSSCLLIIARYQAQTALWHAQAIHRMQAIDQASSLLEQMISQNSVPKSGSKQQDLFNFAWEIIPSGQFVPGGVTSFCFIVMRVSWPGTQGVERFIQLITGYEPATRG